MAAGSACGETRMPNSGFADCASSAALHIPGMRTLVASYGRVSTQSRTSFGPGRPTGRLVPESHARGNERIASVALLGGFALRMTLDNAFG